MSQQTSRIQSLLGSLAALLAVCAPSVAQTWWNADYAKRVPVTITNPGGGAMPTARMTAEIPFTPIPPEARTDGSDMRVVYTPDIGTTWQELDRQYIHDGQLFVTENLNAGKTDYNSLPAGTKVSWSGNGASLDDNWTILTLPFAFPYRNGTTNKLYVAIDGFIAPNMVTDPGRPDSVAQALSSFAIMPWQSDLAITDTAAMGVYADLADPNQVTIRWEVQESASGPIIAKFAVILKPDGSIRFVYSDTVKSPSAGIADPAHGGYSPVKYGVGAGDSGLSKVTAPAFPADFSNHADILYTQSGDVRDIARLVFRLVSPLADGAVSTGQYYVYYGGTSPSAPLTDVRNIYDYVVDFLSSANVVGSPAPDWITASVDEQMTVVNWRGQKVGLLEYNNNGFDHARAIVKDGAMPKFLNLESYGHIAPYGGGQFEQVQMVRVVQNASNTYPDPNVAFMGGYGYATDAFGTYGNDTLTSEVNPAVNRGPAEILSQPRAGHMNTYENILYRVEGQLLSGKAWKDYEPQPFWRYIGVDRTKYAPMHDTTSDPVYDQAGGVGIATYQQPVAVDYIALRELRTTSAVGASETGTPSASRIAGTVTGVGGAGVGGASVTVTGGAVNTTVNADAAGRYQVSAPAGTYSVTASAKNYAPTTLNNVSPSTAETTNVALTYTGVKISGVVRAAIAATLTPHALVTLVDANGKIAAQTNADSKGAYSLVAPAPGEYSIAAMEEPYRDFGSFERGQRQTVTVATAPLTVNFAIVDFANGDMEIPAADYARPQTWEGYRYSGFKKPSPEWTYNTDQNHTPGGHYSIGIKDSLGGDTWIQAVPFFPFPYLNGNFSRHFSVWWYPTVVGQKTLVIARLYDTTNATKQDRQMNVTADATMVNKWNEITADFTPDPTINMMSVRLRGEGGGAGMMYFDDLTLTATPVAQIYGQVTDDAGAPVANAYVGTMSNAAGISDPILVDAPFTLTDESGNYHLYLSETGSQTIGAWAYPQPAADGSLPSYGYVSDVKTSTAGPNPTSPTNFTIRRATNVAKGTTFTAKETDTGTDLGKDTNLPPANAVDDNLNSRWASSPP
ncbi:MAG TPA: carboxypeptidase-like regulatory domain-containing protein, partial [Armatimonadota bacterium]